MIIDAHVNFLQWKNDPNSDIARKNATASLRNTLHILIPKLDLPIITDFLQPLLKYVGVSPPNSDSSTRGVNPRALLDQCRDLLRELSGMRQSSGQAVSCPPLTLRFLYWNILTFLGNLHSVNLRLILIWKP